MKKNTLRFYIFFGTRVHNYVINKKSQIIIIIIGIYIIDCKKRKKNV